MDFPAPPRDNETRNIIDKLAQFVARNGPEFEMMTKSKQENNPKFAFLYGGEFYNYYQYKVAQEQAILKQQCFPQTNASSVPSQNTNMVGGVPQNLQQWISANIPLNSNPAIPGVSNQIVVSNINAPSISTVPPVSNKSGSNSGNNNQQNVDLIIAQQNTLREQIRQSEQNLNAQHGALLRQQQSQIEQIVREVHTKSIESSMEQCGISVSDIDRVLKPIIDSCTKDNISSGKSWILQHATSNTHASAISQYLLEKVVQPEASFNQKLHIIYLVNDVLHHCARKNAEDLKKCLESVVVPMYCHAHNMGDLSEEQQGKLDKLLRLWEAKSNYFDSTLVSKLKSPVSSWQEHLAELIARHVSELTPYTQQTRDVFEGYQQQHQAFVGHAMQQIQNLDSQIVELQKQPHNLANFENKNKSTANQQQSQNQSINLTPLMDINVAPPINLNNSANVSFNSNEIVSEQMTSGFVNQNQTSNNQVFPSANQVTNANQNQTMFGSNVNQNNLFNIQQSTNNQSFSEDLVDIENNMTTNNSSTAQQTTTTTLPPPPKFTQPPPLPPPGVVSLPDLSKPPPGFPPAPPLVAVTSLPPPPIMMGVGGLDTMAEDLTPTIPYFDLPAGLMVPLIKLEDHSFAPLDPWAIRLPPPVPPNERLLAAVEAFYTPYSHDSPRDSEGWEKLGLYEYYKAKNAARKQSQDNSLDSMSTQKNSDFNSGILTERERSGSISPILREFAKNQDSPKRRYRSKSRSRSKSPGTPTNSGKVMSPSLSPTSNLNQTQNRLGPQHNSTRSPRGSGMRERERDRGGDRGRGGDKGDRNRSDSPPPSFGMTPFASSKSSMEQIDESNKGHQMLRRMGWGGTGLGTAGQGIEAPISGGHVRDRQDLYKGVGVNLNDPYENFRKNKGAAFITRMKARAEERS